MESLLNISHVQEYYDDLKLVVDIVEELNLNTRIWTQQGQSAPSAATRAVPEIQIPVSQAPPPPPEQGKPRRYTAGETKSVFKDFVHKADSSMGPKIKAAKRWLKRIAAVFLILLGLPFLFFGSTMAGLIILGFGLFFFAGGFMSAGVEKLAHR